MIKILAFPKERFSENPHILNFYRKIEEAGGYQIWDLDEFSWFKTKYDIFHLHWPEFFVVKNFYKCFFRVIFFILLITFLKICGTKMIWTVHNLYPHEHDHVRPKLYKFLLRFMAATFSHLVFLSETSRKQFLMEFPFFYKMGSAVIPHALYNNYSITENHTVGNLVRKYSIVKKEKIVLFFGKIEKYKNVEKLITEFIATPHDNLLLIAGSSDDPLYVDFLFTLSERDTRVKIINEFIDKDDIAALFSLSDLVCLPFKKILNSGSVMLSLSLSRPVLVPNKGSMAEIQRYVGSSSLVLYEKLTNQVILDALKNTKPPANENLEKFRLVNIANSYKSVFELVKSDIRSA